MVELYRDVYPDRPELVKDAVELEWLFSDPDHPGRFNGFMARNGDGGPAGIIGYVINSYRYRDQVLQGVIPMSWMIAPDHRGILGIQLLMKVMKLGDFGFAIEGSTQAQTSYRAARLRYVASARVYTKVLNVFRYAGSGDPVSPRWWMKGVYLNGRRNGTRGVSPDTSVELFPANGSTGLYYPTIEEPAMIPTDARNRWITSCPLVESITVSVRYRGRGMGTAICYLEAKRNGIKRGRIVHIPYMGNNTDAYFDTITLLEDLLAKQGCCSVSVLAMHPALQGALAQQGYKHLKSASRALYVRDPEKRLQSAPLSDWHLTFYESDKGYRGI